MLTLFSPPYRSFNHDPKIHPNPFVFTPERPIATDTHTPDPHNVSFGFGRRICPGRVLASRHIFSIISHCLAAFNLRKAKGEDGYEIEPKLGETPEIVSHVMPFQCTITPRSSEVVNLIQAVEREYPFEKGGAEILTRMEY
jgi:cytochrome P450